MVNLGSKPTNNKNSYSQFFTKTLTKALTIQPKQLDIYFTVTLYCIIFLIIAYVNTYGRKFI